MDHFPQAQTENGSPASLATQNLNSIKVTVVIGPCFALISSSWHILAIDAIAAVAICSHQHDLHYCYYLGNYSSGYILYYHQLFCVDVSIQQQTLLGCHQHLALFPSCHHWLVLLLLSLWTFSLFLLLLVFHDFYANVCKYPSSIVPS